jgi:hypothetical protein
MTVNRKVKGVLLFHERKNRNLVGSGQWLLARKVTKLSPYEGKTSKRKSPCFADRDFHLTPLESVVCADFIVIVDKVNVVLVG